MTRVEALGLGQHVRLGGSVPHHEMPRHYNLADVTGAVLRPTACRRRCSRGWPAEPYELLVTARRRRPGYIGRARIIVEMMRYLTTRERGGA